MEEKKYVRDESGNIYEAEGGVNIFDILQPDDLVLVDFYSKFWNKRIQRYLFVRVISEGVIQIGGPTVEFFIVDKKWKSSEEALPQLLSVVPIEKIKANEFRLGTSEHVKSLTN